MRTDREVADQARRTTAGHFGAVDQDLGVAGRDLDLQAAYGGGRRRVARGAACDRVARGLVVAAAKGPHSDDQQQHTGRDPADELDVRLARAGLGVLDIDEFGWRLGLLADPPRSGHGRSGLARARGLRRGQRGERRRRRHPRLGLRLRGMYRSLGLRGGHQRLEDDSGGVGRQLDGRRALVVVVGLDLTGRGHLRGDAAGFLGLDLAARDTGDRGRRRRPAADRSADLVEQLGLELVVVPLEALAGRGGDAVGRGGLGHRGGRGLGDSGRGRRAAGDDRLLERIDGARHAMQSGLRRDDRHRAGHAAGLVEGRRAAARRHQHRLAALARRGELLLGGLKRVGGLRGSGRRRGLGAGRSGRRLRGDDRRAGLRGRPGGHVGWRGLGRGHAGQRRLAARGGAGRCGPRGTAGLAGALVLFQLDLAGVLLAHPRREVLAAVEHAVLEHEGLELVVELHRRLVPGLGLTRERLHQDRLEVLGDLGVLAARGGHVDGAHHLEGGEVSVALEQALADQRLVEDDAEGEHVAAAVERHAADLLRGHVAELTLEDAGLGPRHATGGLGDAEVDQLDLALVRDEDVGRADIAVDDVEVAAVLVALVVRVVEALGDLHDDEASLGDRHRPALLLAPREDVAQVLAGDVLEGDVEAVALLTQIVDLGDVPVVELAGDLGLVLEHRDELVILRDVGQDPLDGHDALEALDAVLGGLVHLSHATHADALDQLVRAELGDLIQQELRPVRTWRRAASCEPEARQKSMSTSLLGALGEDWRRDPGRRGWPGRRGFLGHVRGVRSGRLRGPGRRPGPAMSRRACLDRAQSSPIGAGRRSVRVGSGAGRSQLFCERAQRSRGERRC